MMNAEKNNLTYIAYEKSPHMEEAPGRTSLPPSLLSFFKPVLYFQISQPSSFPCPTFRTFQVLKNNSHILDLF